MDRGEIDSSWVNGREESAGLTTPLASYIPKDTDVELPPPQKKPVSLTVKIISGVIILLVIIGTVFILSESGYLTIGIEHWWGLSNKPIKALSEISAVLNQHRSFHLEGETVISIKEESTDGEQTNTAELIGKISQKATEQGILVRSQWTLNDSNNLGELVLGPVFNLGKPVTLEFIIAEENTYLRIVNSNITASCLDQVSADSTKCLADMGWTRVDTREIETLGIAKINWAQWYSLIGQNLITAKRIRGKTINNRKSKGHNFVVDGKNLASHIIKGLGIISWQTEINSWADSRNRLPYLIDVQDKIAAEKIKFEAKSQFLLSAYGDSSLLVTIPAAEQVKNQSLIDWLSENGVINTQSQLAHDAKRKADLTKIAIALEDLATATKPFSYPNTNNQVVRLDKEESIRQALSPYLKKLPSDPLDPDRYYGYKSDGRSFRLSAVLENVSDPTGRQDGDLYLLIVSSGQ